MGYFRILLALASIRFFTKAAYLEGRSETLYAALSLGMWVLFSAKFANGLLGGIVSQVALFLALGLFDLTRTGNSLWRMRMSALLTRRRFKNTEHSKPSVHLRRSTECRKDRVLTK